MTIEQRQQINLVVDMMSELEEQLGEEIEVLRITAGFEAATQLTNLCIELGSVMVARKAMQAL